MRKWREIRKKNHHIHADWKLYLYIKKDICKMADKENLAKIAADRYIKRAVDRAFSL